MTRTSQQHIVDSVAALSGSGRRELSRAERAAGWSDSTEQNTVRAALRWSVDDPATRLRIAVAMVSFWYRSGYAVEALRPRTALRGPHGRRGRTPESEIRATEAQVIGEPTSAAVRCRAPPFPAAPRRHGPHAASVPGRDSPGCPGVGWSAEHSSPRPATPRPQLYTRHHRLLRGGQRTDRSSSDGRPASLALAEGLVIRPAGFRSRC